MTIHKTKDFIGDFEKLPAEIKKLYQSKEKIFKKNWLDPRLHIKRIKELKGVYSFRITRRYRVLFYFRNEDAIFFSIGHRKEIYRS
jgi:mRNA-degrading endonuclease RelE of RelBE toxin-antitoxin system